MLKNINIRFELLFLLLAAVLSFVLVFPIIQSNVDFPFLAKNIFLAMTAVLLFKHIFLLKFTWLNRFQKLKIAIIPFSIPFILVMVRMLNGFTTFADEMPLADMMQDVPYERQLFLARYIKIEYVAVAVMAISAGIILPFRLLISIWREVNRKDV